MLALPLRIPKKLFITVTLITAVLTTFLQLPQPAIFAQAPAPQKIESDDARVLQSGTWINQAVLAASGGAYLFSNGANGDSLTLEFSGPSLEILYVVGPQLGTLAIEIDGTVIRTVITTSDQTAYQQSAQISYLTDEPHTLKIYAQSGVIIGVDAFIISISMSGVGSTAAEVGPQSPRVPCTSLDAIQRVSVTSNGDQVTGGDFDYYFSMSLSGDGRFVAFEHAAVLVPEDTNLEADVFVYDRQLCQLSRVSVASGGTQAFQRSGSPSFSDDGRFVAFQSYAGNLVPGDTNFRPDIFVHDRQTGQTTRVSVNSGGTEANDLSETPVISGDGRVVVFLSAASNLGNLPVPWLHIYAHDRQTGQTVRASQASDGTAGNNTVYYPTISANGRYVAYHSISNNLVPNDTNGQADVFVHDLQSRETTRVSLDSNGMQATGGVSQMASLSTDGRYVGFYSQATNLVPNDTNNYQDAFIHDRQTGQTIRVSVDSNGTQANSGSSEAVISGDGRYAAFYSYATNLVGNDVNGAVPDVFVHDTQTGQTLLVSVAADGTPSNGNSTHPTLSANGQHVGFVSYASNLVSSDTNADWDIFAAPVIRPTIPTTDVLAHFRPDTHQASLVGTLQDQPTASAYYTYNANPPVAAAAGNHWVMGDWDGDGDKTTGVYATNGVFYYTNYRLPTTWSAIWIGLIGRPAVAGHFNGSVNHDCIGAVDSANFPPYGTAFALYFTCDLTNGTAPALTFQWLSVLLPDSGGFSGTHQFAAGDFNNNGVDSIAVRRGEFIAFTNTPPTALESAFDSAQYWGVPPVTGGDAGQFVTGDFDNAAGDSFGVYYANAYFYYRNATNWNPPGYELQRLGQPIGNPVTVTTWR